MGLVLAGERLRGRSEGEHSKRKQKTPFSRVTPLMDDSPGVLEAWTELRSSKDDAALC